MSNNPFHQVRYRFVNGLIPQWHRGKRPIVTGTIMSICLVVWIVQILLSHSKMYTYLMLNYGYFTPSLATVRPWTFITSAFFHASDDITHIIFNMISLAFLGQILENLLGHWRFLLAYLILAVVGNTGMMVAAATDSSHLMILTPSLGASGAIFGLLGMLVCCMWFAGISMQSVLVWLGLNVGMAIIFPNIAWQAHCAGFIGGLLYMLLILFVSGKLPINVAFPPIMNATWRFVIVSAIIMSLTILIVAISWARISPHASLLPLFL